MHIADFFFSDFVSRTKVVYVEWPQELRAGGDLGSTGAICRHAQLWQVE